MIKVLIPIILSSFIVYSGVQGSTLHPSNNGIIRSPMAQYITLNTFQTVSTTPGTTKEYLFTFTDNEFYVVETSGIGNQDTTLTIENLVGGTLTDDDSGEDLFSKIYVTGQSGTLMKIKVTLKSSSAPGNFALQLRRQQMALFGFDYDAFHITTGHLTSPFNNFTATYDAYKFENKTKNYGLTQDSRRYARLNSEVLLFAGHGNGAVNSSTYGGAVAFINSNGTLDWMNLNDFPTMNNVKVAVWSVCYGGSTANEFNNSVVQKAVDQGAKVSFGYYPSVLLSSAKTVSDILFSRMAYGYSFGNAVIDGIAALPYYDTANQYLIVGDSSIHLNTSNRNPEYPFRAQNELSQMTNSIVSARLFRQEISSNYVRYYEMINGKVAFSYYDVFYDGDTIVSFKDMTMLYNDVKPLNKNNSFEAIKGTLQLDSNGQMQKLEKVQKHIIYCGIDGSMHPIEITLMEYQTGSGVVSMEAKCTDLYNGSDIDYERLNSIHSRYNWW